MAVLANPNHVAACSLPANFPIIEPKTASHWFVGICQNESCCRCTEIRVNGVLLSAGVETFLPVRTYAQYQNQQKVSRQTPIFPGYIFARGGDAELVAVKSTRGVMGILRDELPSRLDREVSAIQAAWQLDPSMEAVFGILPGYRCRVLAPHAMQGREGIVESRSRHGRIWIGITTLGAYVPMEIDPALIEIIGDARPRSPARQRLRPSVAAMAVC